MDALGPERRLRPRRRDDHRRSKSRSDTERHARALPAHHARSARPPLGIGGARSHRRGRGSKRVEVHCKTRAAQAGLVVVVVECRINTNTRNAVRTATPEDDRGEKAEPRRYALLTLIRHRSLLPVLGDDGFSLRVWVGYMLLLLVAFLGNLSSRIYLSGSPVPSFLPREPKPFAVVTSREEGSNGRLSTTSTSRTSSSLRHYSVHKCAGIWVMYVFKYEETHKAMVSESVVA